MLGHVDHHKFIVLEVDKPEEKPIKPVVCVCGNEDISIQLTDYKHLFQNTPLYKKKKYKKVEYHQRWRYDLKALRELRKTKGIGRPPSNIVKAFNRYGNEYGTGR